VDAKKKKINKSLIIAFLTAGAGIVILSILYFSGEIFLNPELNITPTLAPANNSFNAESSNLARLKIGEKEINIEIADEDKEQQKGLSGMESLPEDQGMLFVYKDLAIPTFWMRGMRFPIDIIWIVGGKVIDFEKRLPNPLPGTSDDELGRYSPTQPISAVLEVNAGFVEKNNIKIGSKVEFSNLKPSL
jgi:uncharacterized membrane protein (UPF0127 family)